MSNLTEEKEDTLETLLREKDQLITSLQAENDSLRYIISITPGTVYWKDTQGKLLGCNNNQAKLFGYSSPKELVGKSNSDLFNPELASLIDIKDQEILLNRKEETVEEKGIDCQQQIAFYLTKKMVMVNEQNQVTGFVGISFDITDRKLMEQELKIAKENAEAANRAKSQFLAVVNHELRTPLASVIGLINFLKKGKLSLKEQKNIFSTIEKCSEHLLDLVNDVLDFTRLETGKYNLRMIEVNLILLVNEVINLVKPLAENKKLELKIDLPECLPLIFTDSRVLRQILINLVTNAIKYTPTGHVIIQIRLLRQNRETQELEIAVIDTGLGIPADKIDVIFEPFQQLEDAYTRQSSASGTGLGLSIVKKLAELINTQINVFSVLKKGSTFSLVGKFKIQENLNVSVDSSPAVSAMKIKKYARLKNKSQKIFTPEKKSAFKKTPHILLVEDDPIIQYIHQTMLSELGCEIKLASCGRDAINMSHYYNLAFVDISLPDMSGFEVIKKLRQQSQLKIPIIALTVYTGKEQKIACLEAGADEFVNKPISQMKLKRLLLKYVE